MLRLLWMAVIVFATAKNVLVPILGLDDSAVPWICLVMGFVTVIYTAMGGLKAVVSTGALQTFILFLGAFLALFFINQSMGGVSEWWPQRWPANWEDPGLGFCREQNGLRSLNVFLAMLVWHICTEGSDQMTIQRFLATRDAKSARGVLGTMFIVDAIVTGFLVLIGIALFSFFVAHPESPARREDGVSRRGQAPAAVRYVRATPGRERTGGRRAAGGGDVQSCHRGSTRRVRW